MGLQLFYDNESANIRNFDLICAMKRFFLPCLLAFLPHSLAKAYSTDQLQVSLLTVEPRDNHVYTVYGHTALRLFDPSKQTDAVFNWGTFDFNAPHFLYRFIRGETDFFLSVSTYRQFLDAYRQEGASIVEQVLDISPEGKEKLLEKLSVNLLPENRIYRYNFLFDNCTTRVRDLIEQCDSGFSYPTSEERTTFRQWIHSCTKSHSWMTFGIDLLIGSGADSLISARQELFLPANLQKALDRSHWRSASPLERKPVVRSSSVALAAPPLLSDNAGHASPPFPFLAGCFLLIFCICLALSERDKGRRGMHRPVFASLFLIAGLLGCILAFMALFSEHPVVSPNWNLLWLHPFHWIAFAGYLKQWRKPAAIKGWTLYHAASLLLLCGPLAAWHWIPQAFNPAAIPCILCLAIASGHWIFVYPKQ
jgi:hypothetical protein